MIPIYPDLFCHLGPSSASCPPLTETTANSPSDFNTTLPDITWNLIGTCQASLLQYKTAVLFVLE